MIGYTQVKFEIKDEHVPRFIEAMASRFGYRETLVDGTANLEPKPAYVRRMILGEWKNIVKSYETAKLTPPDEITIEE
jgi:hypothetical protein